MASDRTDAPENPPQRPMSENPDAWRAYWQALGQPWRTEPEIDEERKEDLARQLAITPDPGRDEYPFKGMWLSRGDVEWLLGSPEAGRDSGDHFLGQKHREGLDLRHTNLHRTNLSHLPLWAAHLEGASLQDAHLEGAFLWRAHLEEAILWGAHLEGARLNNAHLEGASLQNAHLKSAELQNAHLEGASLEEAHLEEAVLWGARLEGTSLRDAHLEGAFLSRAHLEGAFLSRAHLEGASLQDAHLEGAFLSGAHLEGAFLSRAHLEGKRMEPDDLARLSRWKKNFPEMLSPADLRGAFFDIGTDLSSISFSGTEHVSPRLADLRWNGVNLAVVDWEEVDALGDEHYAEDLEDYKAAVRANRQLALVLRDQGMTEEADRFFYRSRVLQREVFRRQRQRKEYLFSLFGWVLAGYGYRPWWTLGWYVSVIFVCGWLYYLLGINDPDPNHHLNLLEAFTTSVISFHGRGVFASSLNDLQSVVAAVQAFLGLGIEIAFIVTFTQRFFGK